MKCDNCKKFHMLKGAVVNGAFGHYCPDCIKIGSRQSSPSVASFQRNTDRQTHEKDMVQPWANGKPNRDFIRAYPDKAKDYFNQKELETYG